MNMHDYFEMEDDVDDSSHPWLENPCYNGEPIEPDLLTSGIRFPLDDGSKMTVDTSVEQEFDFCFGELDLPIGSKAFCDVLTAMCPRDVQLIPVTIGSMSEFFIINVLSRVRCLDENRSEFTKWTAMDRRPDKVGCYRMVTQLIVERACIQGQHIFRVDGWDQAIIISAQLAFQFRSLAFRGFRLKSVIAAD